MATVRFRELTHRATKNLPCPGCGKKVRRARTFSQTLNPFNKNASGHPKTIGEIHAELCEKAAAWESEPVTCTPCTEQGGAA